MQIWEILTKPLTSKENSKLIVLCLIGVLWIGSLFSIFFSFDRSETHELIVVTSVLPLQFLLTVLYTEYRAAVVRKELLQKQENIKFALKAHEQAKHESS